MSGESLPSGVLKVADLLPTLKRAMQTLSDNIRRRQGAEQVREGIQRAMGDLQTVHMALHEAGTRFPECGWMRGHDYGCPRDPLNPGASPPTQATGALSDTQVIAMNPYLNDEGRRALWLAAFRFAERHHGITTASQVEPEEKHG
jgi:hypothetical protein